MVHTEKEIVAPQVSGIENVDAVKTLFSGRNSIAIETS